MRNTESNRLITECDRLGCGRKAKWVVEIIGCDILLCTKHRIIHPFSQFIINIHLKILLWRYDRIHWGLFNEVFQPWRRVVK